MNTWRSRSFPSKGVEDVHEALAGAHAELRFGPAFCESSGDCLVRRSENARNLVEVADRHRLLRDLGHEL